MLPNDLVGFGLFLGYFLVIGLPILLFNVYLKLPSEIVRKMLHIVATLSIFPLLEFFTTWYAAVLAALMLVLIMYPLLARVEGFALYQRLAPQRAAGEFKSSLIVIQLALAILIFIFWGLLGESWKYIAVVAVMAWGFGDAAAALVGKAIGRRRIVHPRIEGAKTYEGTLAMFIVAGLAIYFTLLMYAGQSWQVSAFVAALVAPASATVELFSNRGVDTFTVPLAVAFMVLPLMFIMSFLGM